MRRVLVIGAVCLWPAAAAALDPLPEGDPGIAAGYPNDEGIADDPQVIFFDDFESYADPQELWNRWDNVYQIDDIRFATEPENVWAGAQSIEFTLPQQDGELSNSCDKSISPERDVMFLRYYSKFMPPFDVVGSSHNGSSISAHYFIDNGHATPGIPADGTNKFLVAYENWRGDAGDDVARGPQRLRLPSPSSATTTATTSSRPGWSCPTPASRSTSGPTSCRAPT